MDIQQEIEKLIEEYQSLQLAKNHLIALNKRIEEESQLLQELGLILKKEYEDVEQFEKLSLRSIFHKVLGNEEEQLEIEKQEYLFAVMKYNECEKMLDLQKFEKKVLDEKITKEEEIEKQLSELLTNRQLQIAQKYPGIQRELKSINEDIDLKFGLKRELHEAVIAGAKAFETISQIAGLLQKARDWGNWKDSKFAFVEIMSPTANNSYIDQAQELSYKAQQQLLVFEDELKDIQQYQKRPSIYRYDDFQHFADLYYNRLISDWIVKKKIHNTLSNILGTKDSVIRIVNSLKNELKTTGIGIDYLEQKKKELLLTVAKE